MTYEKFEFEDLEKFLAAIVSSLREPLVILDANLCVVFANSAFFNFFKVDENETLGQNLQDLGNGQWDIPELTNLLHRLGSDKKEICDFQLNHTFQSIGNRTMSLNAKKLEISSKIALKSKLILLAIEDISERKRLNSALLESERRFHSLFETAQDGLLLISKSSAVISDVNPKFLSSFGYKKAEALKLKPWDIGLCKDAKTFSKFEKILYNIGFIHFEELQLQTKHGQTVPCEVFLVNRAEVYQCNIRDITERKIAEDVLIHSIQMQSDFTSMVAHELRTPLAAMKEAAAIISEGILGEVNQEQSKYLLMVQSNVDRMARLINSALSLQEIASGKMQLDRKICDITNLLSQAADAVTLLTNKKGLLIKRLWPDNLPEISIDKDKVFQAINNLLYNAVKYTPTGEIEINAIEEGGFIKISVKDTGIGIKKENLKMLFLEFSQIKQHAGSSGLGLFITKGTIEEHGGQLGVESEYEKGSTFYFTLPIRT